MTKLDTCGGLLTAHCLDTSTVSKRGKASADLASRSIWVLLDGSAPPSAECR